MPAVVGQTFGIVVAGGRRHVQRQRQVPGLVEVITGHDRRETHVVQFAADAVADRLPDIVDCKAGVDVHVGERQCRHGREIPATCAGGPHVDRTGRVHGKRGVHAQRCAPADRKFTIGADVAGVVHIAERDDETGLGRDHAGVVGDLQAGDRSPQTAFHRMRRQHRADRQWKHARRRAARLGNLHRPLLVRSVRRGGYHRASRPG